MTVEQKYIEQQLYQVAPLPITEENYPDGFDIKICTTVNGNGTKATNYLRITPEQMQDLVILLFAPSLK